MMVSAGVWVAVAGDDEDGDEDEEKEKDDEDEAMISWSEPASLSAFPVSRSGISRR